ncbi:MAG: hypothetical protein ABWY65_05085 [Thermoleophilaceae bacterium]
MRDDKRRRTAQSGVLMDLISIAIAVVSFAVLLFLVEGLDRV